MRTLKRFLMLGLVALVPFAAFAQEVAADPVPEWAKQFMATAFNLLNGIAAVSPVLATVLLVLGIVASVMTALSAAAQAILMALSAVSGWAGLASWAEKIKTVSDKVLPWLKYVSSFNVQKK